MATGETVRTENLWKTYQTGPIEYGALKGVNVSISRGEFVAVVGPSGSGKTTFLNLIGTLDRPTRGEILLDGIPTSNMNRAHLARLRNKKLGFIFQSYNLIPYLSAMENVETPLIALNVSGSKRRNKAKMLLEQLGLGDKGGKKPRELSGGEQQRVAIARSLVNDPALILADEPTGNLDSKSAQNVAALLKHLSEEQKVTILMVTHNMEVARYAHRAIHLRDGVVEKEVLNA